MFDRTNSVEDWQQEVYIKLLALNIEMDNPEAYVNQTSYFHFLNKVRTKDILRSAEELVQPGSQVSNREIKERFTDLSPKYSEYTAMHEAIKTLPTRQRRIIEMVLDGKEVKDIAVELKITYNTAKAGMLQARTSIKKYLASQGYNNRADLETDYYV